jgi:hypothetical protein
MSVLLANVYVFEYLIYDLLTRPAPASHECNADTKVFLFYNVSLKIIDKINLYTHIFTHLNLFAKITSFTTAYISLMRSVKEILRQ